MIITFFHIAHSLSYVSLRLVFYVNCFEFQQCCYWWRRWCCCCHVLISIYFPCGTHTCECECVYFLCHEVSKAMPSNIRHHNSIRCVLLWLSVPTTSRRLYSIISFWCDMLCFAELRYVCASDHEHQATGITSVHCTRNSLKSLITK